MHDIVTDGVFYTGDKDPPGQASTYIPPGDVRKEQYRLATFKSFPPNSPVHPIDLASSGFYSVGYQDRVKCFCCGATVEHWVVGDNPFQSKWHRPNCDFANSRETTNIPMKASKGLLTKFMRSSLHTSATQPKIPSFHQASLTNQQNLTVPVPIPRPEAVSSSQSSEEYPFCQYPVNPQMRSLTSRIESFRMRNGISWPVDCIHATVDELATAGFFFLGQNDRVKCWYCNGGIQNWNYDDDPWIEHAKWFPSCEFVRKIKGTSFVQHITSQYPDIVRPVPFRRYAAPQESNSENAVTNAPNMAGERNMLRTVQNAMPRLNYVTKAKDMGFSIQLITQVLLRKYQENGQFFLSDQEFFETLFSVENTVNEPSPPRETSDVRNEDSHENRSNENEIGSSSLASTSQQASEIPRSSNDDQSASQLRSLTKSRLCKTCKQNLSNVVTLPCGHICICDDCAKRFSKCPVCATKITEIIKTFRA